LLEELPEEELPEDELLPLAEPELSSLPAGSPSVKGSAPASVGSYSVPPSKVQLNFKYTLAGYDG